VGENVKLTLTVKNNGPSDATGVKTTYYLPYGLKHVSISSNFYNPFNGLWSIGNLTDGSTISLEVTGKVENAGLINNTAVVSGNQTDPYTTNNKANLLLKVYHGSTSGNSGNSGNGNGNSNGDGSNGNHNGNSGGNSGSNGNHNGSGGGSGGSQNGNGNHNGNGGSNPGSGNGNGNSPPNLNSTSIYGPFAPILESPLNPLFGTFYTMDKLIQAGQKAWQTGNIWDFFNYNFLTIPGYNNLNNMWGGQSIKWLLDVGVGIDENGNMSVGSFLINLASIATLGIGKLGITGAKVAIKIFGKSGVELITGLMRSYPQVEVLLKNIPNIISMASNVLKPAGIVLDMINVGGKRVLDFLGKNNVGKILKDAGLLTDDIIKGGKTVIGNVWNFITTRNILGAPLELLNPQNWTAENLIKRYAPLITTGTVITKAVYHGVKRVATAVYHGVQRVARRVYNGVRHYARRVYHAVRHAARAVYHGVRRVARQVYHAVRHIGRAVYHGVRHAARRVYNGVRTVARVVNQAANNVGRAVNHAVNAVRSFFHW